MFVSNIFDTSGSLIPWETFQPNYDLPKQTYYKWLQIVKALPGEWKNKISSENTVLDITNVSPHLLYKARMLSLEKLTSKELYKIIISKITDKPTNRITIERITCTKKLKLE